MVIYLWQNRFYSCALDDGRFWTALRYAERNPVRARMVRRAWEYEWSSAAAHTGGGEGTGLLDIDAWEQMSAGMDWREMLREREDEQEIGQLRLYTRTGRPLGSDRFLSKIEAMVGRRVRALPVGRPSKARRRRE